MLRNFKISFFQTMFAFLLPLIAPTAFAQDDLLKLIATKKEIASAPAPTVKPNPPPASQSTLNPNAPTLSSLKEMSSPLKLNPFQSMANSEITRLCQQPGGCQFLMPTPEDGALANDQEKCFDCSYILKVFDYGIQNNLIPKETLLLAAAGGLKNPVLTEVLTKALPPATGQDIANRLATYADAQGLHNLENPTARVSRPTITIGVGPDGSYQIQGGAVTRNTQISDALASNLLYRFGAAEGAGQTSSEQTLNLSNLPRTGSPFVREERTVSSGERTLLGSIGAALAFLGSALNPFAPSLEAGKFINPPLEISPPVETGRPVVEALPPPKVEPLPPPDPNSPNSTQDPNATPLRTPEEIQALGLKTPTTAAEAFIMRNPGLVGDTGGIVSSYEAPDQIKIDPASRGTLSEITVQQVAGQRLKNVTMPLEGGILSVVSGQGQNVPTSACQRPPCE